jgi:hypothetical protein
MCNLQTVDEFFDDDEPSAPVAPPESRLAAVEKEIQRWLELPEDRNMDTLQYMKVHASEFPHVSQLIKKYCAIPASTAPSERVFSTAKNIVTHKRNRLLPDRVHKCIFLRHNNAILHDVLAKDHE